MSTTALVIFAAGCFAIGALAMLGIMYGIGRPKPATPLPTPEVRVPVYGTLASPWRALPGDNRLELPSGFYIELHTSARADEPFYRLFTPESRLLSAGFDLPHLKALGERFSSERAEFAYQATAAAPPPREP